MTIGGQTDAEEAKEIQTVSTGEKGRPDGVHDTFSREEDTNYQEETGETSMVSVSTPAFLVEITTLKATKLQIKSV